jgi:hypothetical protein
MNLENELLEKFQVEELEKRFEMGWIGDVVVGTTESPTGTSLLTGDVTPFVQTGVNIGG